jgi:hypothetical protein
MKKRYELSLFALAALLAGCASLKTPMTEGKAPSKGPRSADQQTRNKSAQGSLSKKAKPLQRLGDRRKGAVGTMTQTGPDDAFIAGGAYDNEHRVRARRIGPKIRLPENYGRLVRSFDQPLSLKPRIACIVVEGAALRLRKTRGMSRLLAAQTCFEQVLSLENLKQDHDLRRLISYVRGQGIDLLVILEKKQERSFAVVDARSSQLLALGSGRRRQVVSGHKILESLYKRLCQVWAVQ